MKEPRQKKTEGCPPCGLGRPLRREDGRCKDRGKREEERTEGRRTIAPLGRWTRYEQTEERRGETKWVFEKFLQAYHDAKKLDFISLRYFNAAGADPDGELGEDHQNETHLNGFMRGFVSTGLLPFF